jgi:hypothetical protein
MKDTQDLRQDITYYWHRISTGQKGTRVMHITRAEMLENLNLWNRCGAGSWVYWI